MYSISPSSPPSPTPPSYSFLDIYHSVYNSLFIVLSTSLHSGFLVGETQHHIRVPSRVSPSQEGSGPACEHKRVGTPCTHTHTSLQKLFCSGPSKVSNRWGRPVADVSPPFLAAGDMWLGPHSSPGSWNSESWAADSRREECETGSPSPASGLFMSVLRSSLKHAALDSLDQCNWRTDGLKHLEKLTEGQDPLQLHGCCGSSLPWTRAMLACWPLVDSRSGCSQFCLWAWSSFCPFEHLQNDTKLSVCSNVLLLEIYVSKGLLWGNFDACLCHRFCFSVVLKHI